MHKRAHVCNLGDGCALARANEHHVDTGVVVRLVVVVLGTLCWSLRILCFITLTCFLENHNLHNVLQRSDNHKLGIPSTKPEWSCEWLAFQQKTRCTRACQAADSGQLPAIEMRGTTILWKLKLDLRRPKEAAADVGVAPVAVCRSANLVLKRARAAKSLQSDKTCQMLVG